MSDPKFLHLWEPRETAAQLLAVPRYLRNVKRGKLIIGVLVLTMVLSVILIPLLRSDERGMRIALSAVTPTEGESEAPVMLNPRFESTSKDDLPFHVQAKTAEQLDAERVRLNAITGDIELKDGSWLSMQSDNGLFNLTTSQLLLAGNVQLLSDDGYEFYTDRVQVDLKTASAVGDQPVTGIAPMGKLKADSFQVTDRGQRIRFVANVTLTIYP
jgi:lipopolysaccharide export system protein LptC